MATTMGSFDLASLKKLRDDVTQYFWFESNSSSAWGSGAHVTLYPESQFTDSTSPNYMKGQNIIMNTDGFSIRNGALPMMVLDNDSLDFNAVNTTQGTYITMATFGLTGATIGQTSGAHSVIDSNGQRIYASDGTTQIANLGYGDGTNKQEGISLAPYYKFGTIPSNVQPYNPLNTYNLGDLCIYDDKLYVCKINMEEAEAWTSSHWVYYIGNFSFSEGWNTLACGAFAHAEGDNNVAFGESSHAEGTATLAGDLDAHAEGSHTVAYNASSHAEGSSTTASGYASHAEGEQTVASKYYSHAEGVNTTASGNSAHAEGTTTTASGNYSHAQNYGTNASKYAQTAIGTCNKIDTSSTTTHPSGDTHYGNYAFIIGNGDAPSSRSDALTIDWAGNIKSAGALTMENHTDPIGWFYPISNTVSKATGTSFASISGSAYTPTAGRYLVTASARYSGATSGNRGVCIYQGGSVVDSTQVIVPAIPSASWSTDLKTMGYFTADGSTEFRIGLLQSSGSSLSTSYTLTFIRIR